MKLRKRVFEETYGAKKVFEYDVDEFKNEEYMDLYKSDGKYVISFEKPGFSSPYDYMVLEATDEEIRKLKKYCIESVNRYIKDLEKEIEKDAWNKEYLEETVEFIKRKIFPKIEVL